MTIWIAKLPVTSCREILIQASHHAWPFKSESEISVNGNTVLVFSLTWEPFFFCSLNGRSSHVLTRLGLWYSYPQLLVVLSQLFSNWQTKLEYDDVKSWGFLISKSWCDTRPQGNDLLGAEGMYECVRTIEKRGWWKQLVDRDDRLHHLGLHAQISQGFLLRPSMLFCFVGFFFPSGSLGLVLNSYHPRNWMYLTYLSGHLTPPEYVWSGFLIQWSSADFSLTKGCEATL